MSAWTCLRQGRLKDRSTSSSNPMMEGPCADSGEKHEPASDVDAAAVDSLKALDPSRPIREADIGGHSINVRPPKADIAQGDRHVRFVPKADSCSAA
jgi:hypothetical protein